jgi:hypothetical protein
MVRLVDNKGQVRGRRDLVGEELKRAGKRGESAVEAENDRNEFSLKTLKKDRKKRKSALQRPPKHSSTPDPTLFVLCTVDTLKCKEIENVRRLKLI